jgi:glyoxylase-like metal-dependent hydrolase (beta-lactamase superfamily II)
MNKSIFNQLTKHVYWLSPDETTDRPVLGAITGTAGTLIVDAGNSTAHAGLLLDELAKNEIVPPKYLVLTHWHWDHVFGTAAFNIPSFASQETKCIVEEMAQLDWSDKALDGRVEAGTEIEFCRDMMKKELPDRTSLTITPPDIAFTHQIEIDLGSVTCHVVHVGGDHASDASVVHIPQDKVVFLSDCLYDDLYNGPRHYTTQKLFPLLDKVLNFKADYYLLGHHTEPMSLAGMLEYALWLKTIGRKVEAIGENRDLIHLDLEEVFDRPLDEDDVEIVEAFLVGLEISTPQRQSSRDKTL